MPAPASSNSYCYFCYDLCSDGPVESFTFPTSDLKYFYAFCIINLYGNEKRTNELSFSSVCRNYRTVSNQIWKNDFLIPKFFAVLIYDHNIFSPPG